MSGRKIAASIVVVMLIFGGGLLLPCTCIQPMRVRETTAHDVSMFHLKEIGLTVHAYHGVYKKLPPAVVCAKDGRPLYSWRVLLLPFLEQAPLYNRFKLDEPWDSDHNKSLLEPTPPIYDLWGPDDPRGTTRYQVFVGPGTAFERDGLTFSDFPNGLSWTILAVESGEPVPLTKPADLAYDPNAPLPPLGAGYSLPVRWLCYTVDRNPVFNALMADGSCRFFLNSTEEQTLRSLITRNGAKEDQRAAWE